MTSLHSTRIEPVHIIAARPGDPTGGTERHRCGDAFGVTRTSWPASESALPLLGCSTVCHSNRRLERQRRPAPCGQRRNTTALPSVLKPRHEVKHKRSRPEVLTIEAGTGPDAVTTNPVVRSTVPRCRWLTTVSSSSPQAVKFVRSADQHGFGSSWRVPAHAGQKPQLVRCSGSPRRKSATRCVVLMEPDLALKCSRARIAAGVSATALHGASCACV